MNLLDDLRLREIQQLVIPLQVLALPIRKPLPAKLLLAELVLLDRRPHRAIDDDDAFAEQGFEGMEVGHGAGENRTRCRDFIKKQIFVS